MPNEILAKSAAAAEALKKLKEFGEVDDFLIPLHNKEKYKKENNVNGARLQGTNKQRQYYYKSMAKCLTAAKKDKFYLYSIVMTLNCPIPEDQNTRGRKIYPPEEASQSFGFFVSEKLTEICAFPIYTRSGEVLVSLRLLQSDVTLSEDQMKSVLNFHKYTFSNLLRMEKYPMVFSPEKSDNSVLIVPLTKKDGNPDQRVIDWSFLELIDTEKDNKLKILSDEERKDYKFKESDYSDAVVMPWYRNQDQPQYFYVAEICKHLNPKSDFPAEGFESFELYYKEKYDLQIQDFDQPLLDVDHTSARLNFLTPRYVNRKGVALPSSSEETKRSKRENLDQKQILIPELCAVHPFPASLWRQTVCLPCIFYRLNGLLVADNLRYLIAKEAKIGLPVVPSDFQWETLNFGWTLADVLKNRDELSINGNNVKKDGDKKKIGKSPSQSKDEPEAKSDLEALSDQIVSKMTEEDKRLKV